MRKRSAFFAACCFAATAVCAAVSGCSSSESRARDAYSEYQSAAALGDLTAARNALLKLVAAQDDDPNHWKELGKVQVELQAYPEAYYAFTRAHELDRADVETLAALTQLALVSGNIDVAEDHAKSLEILKPDHPAVKLTYGYVALRRSNYDEANRQVDALLESFPHEAGATLLKGRIFSAQGEYDQAIALFEVQANAAPDDVGALKSLISLSQRAGNWSGVASAASRLWKLRPDDSETGRMVVDASLRAGDVDGARRASAQLLKPQAPPSQVESVLDVWADHWKSPAAIDEARRFAAAADGGQKLAYAGYFNRVGSAEDAFALIGDKPLLPLKRWNLSTNALIASSFVEAGRTAEAKQLFDGILAQEPDHVYALRGRINLEIRTGNAKAAIIDAQRLVSVEPDSARDRLLLAQAYSAAGDGRQVDRTLWNAFHEIPANLELYEVLRAHVLKTAGADAALAVDREDQLQRDVSITREFI